MDLLTGASAFATIVGLICNYKSEHQLLKADEYQDFILWLDNKNHQELISEIKSNPALSTGIKILIKNNHDEVITKLNALESSMAAVSSNISGLKEISKALSPHAGLSNQAFSILKQFNDSGDSVFLETNLLSGTEYQFLNTQDSIDIDDPRFVKDDLHLLCNLGLLIPDVNSKGRRLFRFTRAASKLINASEL